MQQLQEKIYMNASCLGWLKTYFILTTETIIYNVFN